MNRNTLFSSPDVFDWGDLSTSDSLPQTHEGPANLPAPSHADGFHPYDAFRTATTNAPQAPSTFQDYNSRFALTEESTREERPPAASDLPQPRALRRSRQGNLDLEDHKDELKNLYLIEDKSLKEVMTIMHENHSLPISMKRYKDRFEAWGWRKNLPGEYAQWMVQKAHKRKREDGKETVFHYGGLQWDKAEAERSATRSKKPRSGTTAAVVETPSEIDYQTPSNTAISPQSARSPLRRSVIGKQVAQTEFDPEDDENELTLRWRGHSREELLSIFESAQSHAETQSKRAEDLFSTALEGYKHLLGPTHEEVFKVTFAMASFYAEQGRSTDADKVLDDLCRCYISKFGFDDRRTQQLILHVVEVLNGWNRGLDALTFLARSKNLAEYESGPAAKSRIKSHRRGMKSNSTKRLPDNELLDIAQDIVSTKNAARIDYGIELARTHVAANDITVEAFLQAIIHHCDVNTKDLDIQNLKARSELLKLYNKTNRLEQRRSFLSAIEVARIIIGRNSWDKQCFKGFDVLEALLELSATILKGGFEHEAWALFSQIEHKAEDDFGWDEERTIWGKISIGIIYERYKGWEHAESWFNHAYAASTAANGDQDGISKALQVALEKHHFSYLSNEGRPFKTIFGVSGLTFRPIRLHID
ncbi:hypothetical protein BP5796_05597 [Coleophoma crateriformis]|uniref:Clr5 domain-containing protein n=1 Tax=Coleophoma crateriformis TaxID=565419 RepID=A0A3D8S3N1_9HELO|nr:hypothetical protein BP5796_05597 [Coleophoma crateriformis]